MFESGSVFWEKTYRHGSGIPHIPVYQSGSDSLSGRGSMFEIDLGSNMNNCIKAEVAIEYWGGHIGTSEQKFRINDSEWLYFPQPCGTPTDPHLYFRTILGNPPVSVPMGILKNSINVFEFHAGKQRKYGWENGGFYWVYALTVRLYYSDPTTHLTGRIVSPVSGVVHENPRFEVEVDDIYGTLDSIDIIGCYRDFDWTGTGGSYRKWYYSLLYGRMINHMGTIRNNRRIAPHSLVWDTAMLPDQEEELYAVAKITNLDNISYITEQISFRFERTEGSLKMYEPTEVPEYFSGHFWKQQSACVIEVTDDIRNAESAWLVMSNWSFAHVMKIGLNNEIVLPKSGYIHNHSYACFEIPLTLILLGKNVFFIFNDGDNHPAEVNWPGPCLFIKYRAANISIV